MYHSQSMVQMRLVVAGALVHSMQEVHGEGEPESLSDGVSTVAQVVEFYKAWDLHGALSNFSAHSVSMPRGPVSTSGRLPQAAQQLWPSVEHFYQSQKFEGGLESPAPLIPTSPCRCLTDLADLSKTCVSVSKIAAHAEAMRTNCCNL